MQVESNSYMWAYVFLAVLALLALVQVLLCVRVVRLLKQHHPLEWERLGRPGLFVIGSITTTILFWRYVFSGRHVQLGDPVFSRSARWLACISFGYVLVLGGLFVMVFVGILLASLASR